MKKKLIFNLVTKNQETRLYQTPVPIIGLTGGIATGKSTVASIFKSLGLPIIDADGLIKKIYKKEETIEFIKKNFPEAFINQQIDFKRLREIVFNDDSNLSKVESYLYQFMPSEFKNAFLQFQNPEFVIYDVPLLFEKGLDKFVDISICVYANEATQIERIIKRDQVTREQAIKVLAHQMPIEEKRRKASFTVENSGAMDELNQNVRELLRKILESALEN